jgi:hypothetical protein
MVYVYTLLGWYGMAMIPWAPSAPYHGTYIISNVYGHTIAMVRTYVHMSRWRHTYYHLYHREGGSESVGVCVALHSLLLSTGCRVSSQNTRGSHGT